MRTTETIAIKKPGLHWLEQAPVTWDANVSELSMSEKQELARWLDGITERAARLSGYLDARGVITGSDNGHADGVKGSNRQAAKVRKALGFTQPRHDLSF